VLGTYCYQPGVCAQSAADQPLLTPVLLLLGCCFVRLLLQFDINCGVRLIRTNLTLADVEPVKEQLAQVRPCYNVNLQLK
jgi:hypothetical protein